MPKKTLFLIGVLVVVTIVLFVIAFKGNASAHYDKNTCAYWEDCEIITIMPTVSPVPSDEVSPTVFDTPEVSPSVSEVPTSVSVPNGDDSGDVNSCLHHDCSGNKVGGGGSSNSPIGPPMTGRAQ